MSTKLTDDEKKSMSIVTGEFRVSHPHVFKPTRMKDPKTGKESGDPSYTIEMLFDKSTTSIKDLQKPLIAAAKKKWGSKENWPDSLKFPIRDGDKPHGKKKEVKKEHRGMWVVKASTKAEYGKPYVVGPNPKKALENESDLYAGCIARAALFARVYEFADKEGVKFVLDGVQKIRDGEAISSKKPADQVFGVIEGEDAGDDDSFDWGPSDSGDADEDDGEGYF